MLRLILGTNNPNVRIDLQSISITPTKSATIKYQLISTSDGINDHTLIIDGQQYAVWGTDDTIIYNIICARHNLTYVPYVEPQFYEEVLVYKNEQGQFITENIQKQNPNYVAQ